MSERLWDILINAFPRILLKGIQVTIPLTVLSFALGFGIALFLALVQVAGVPVLSRIARFYIWIFRGTPLLVQLFIIFFGLPSLGIMLDAFPAAVIAFGMNLGAYNAEVLRSAILAVPAGQSEAAALVGMTGPQTMIHVVLPQAFPVAFPPLFNSLIGLVKDTSLASSITVIELFTTAQQIAARTFEPFALYCEAAVVYLIFCSFLTWLQRTLENKLVWKTPEEKMTAGDEERGENRSAGKNEDRNETRGTAALKGQESNAGIIRP